MLIGNLEDASKLLESTMSKYTEACAAILDNYSSSGNAAKCLLDHVVAELPRAFDYDSKLQKAISLMWRVRNQSPSIVPINILPPEIMSRIFWFGRHCCLPKSQLTRRDEPSNDTLIYPETALEVCHRWREIALASHNLWSHIDIDLTSGSKGMLFLRALGFATRSNQAPIDLHIRIDFYFREDQRLSDFFHSIVPRTRSIDFQSDCRTPLPSGFLPLMASLLSCDTAGVLRRICFNAQPMRGWYFLTSTNPISTLSRSIPLQVDETTFERMMSPITSMQLDGIYPHWSSRAYAGLVELDLNTSQPVGIGISEIVLANVLQASPGLRTFIFGLKLKFEPQSILNTPDPVNLNHLDVLKLVGRHTDAHEAVLRMIYPGQLPLHSSAEVDEHYEPASPSPYWTQFINLISRSKITQLDIQGVAEIKISLGSQLFAFLPQLQVLTLYEIVLGRACEEVLGDYDTKSFLLLLQGHNRDHLGSKLQLAHFTRCKIYWNDFRYATEIHPNQTLELDQCQLVTIPPEGRHIYLGYLGQDARSTLMNKIRLISPRVELKTTFVNFEELKRYKLEPPLHKEDTEDPDIATFGAVQPMAVPAFGGNAAGPNPNATVNLFGTPAFGL